MDTPGASFPKATKADWMRAASAEIEGKNPFDALAWQKHGITFLPYYDRTDAEVHDYAKNFQRPPSQLGFGAPRHWLTLPRLTVSDEKKANELALNHLNHGADGVLFDLRQRNDINLNALLHKIDWPYCAVSFFVTPSNEILAGIVDYVARQNYDPASLNGTLWWETLPTNTTIPVLALAEMQNFHALGIVQKQSTPAQEIAEALTLAARCMEALDGTTVNPTLAWRSMALSLSVDTDFFFTVAKLKAARMLWHTLAHAFDVNTYRYEHLHLHATSDAWIHEKFQPHGNLLKSTTAGLSAILGGCDALTVLPETDNNSLTDRMARNVSTILREESHLDKVADPLAGAYVVTEMVNALAQDAWQLFQQNMQTR